MATARGNQWLLPVVLAALLLALAIVVGGAVIALGGAHQPAATILRVPGDYQTIQSAIDSAQPGDIIQVAPGTYRGPISLNKAVSLAAATFDQTDPANNTTILDGNNGEAVIVIPAGMSQMPAIRGFVIRNSKDVIQANSEFIAEYNYFYGSSMPADYLKGSGGVNRSNLYFNSADDAIHVDDIDRPLLIENNRVMYAGDDAIEIGLQTGSVPASVNEVDIWNNMLIGSREDGIKFVDYGTAPQDKNRRFVIVSNLIANNRRAGIGLMSNANTTEDYSGADVAESVRVYNNTFYGNDYGISGGDNLVAFNNIIANTVSRGAWRVQGAAGANSVIAYSLLFGNRVDSDQSTLGQGDIFGKDPLFMAAPSPGPDGEWGTVDDDFSGLLLQPGSPAIDKGVTQLHAADGEAVPPTPISGFAGSAPDLGWREFGSPIFITPTAIINPQATLDVTSTAVIPATTAPPATETPTSAPSATPAQATATGTPASATATAGTPTAGGSPTAGSSATAAATGTPEARVQIGGVSPSSTTAGATLTLTITGSGFQMGANVSFEGLTERPPQITNVEFISPTTLVVGVDASTDDKQDTDVWNIRVTNPDASTTVLDSAFTVTLP